MRKLICLALFVCAPPLCAGTVYQWVGEDGAVVYSDEPPPGREAVEITVPDRRDGPTPPAPARAEGRQSVEDRSREISRQTQSRIERRATLQQQLRAAKEAVEEARQALLAGEEPKEGERIANVGGGTRLSPAYFQRLDSLKARVKSAEEKVHALQKQLKALGR